MLAFNLLAFACGMHWMCLLLMLMLMLQDFF